MCFARVVMVDVVAEEVVESLCHKERSCYHEQANDGPHDHHNVVMVFGMCCDLRGRVVCLVDLNDHCDHVVAFHRRVDHVRVVARLQLLPQLEPSPFLSTQQLVGIMEL